MDDGTLGLMHFWRAGDAVTHSVAWLLLAMSIVSWYVILAKGWSAWRMRRGARAALERFWSARSLDEAVDGLLREDAERVFSPMADKAHRAARMQGGGTLGAQLGEQIAVAVADRNACNYCLAAHTALGRAADHDGVGAGRGQHQFCLFRGRDVAIGNHGNADRGLDGGDRIVFGFAAVAVGAGASVQGQHGDAGLFGDAGDALGDSIYEAKLFVRGSVKSLGADCIEKEMRPEHHEQLAMLLDKAGIKGVKTSEFKRYGSARKLYNFNIDNADAY